MDELNDIHDYYHDQDLEMLRDYVEEMNSRNTEVDDDLYDTEPEGVFIQIELNLEDEGRAEVIIQATDTTAALVALQEIGSDDYIEALYEKMKEIV